MGQRLASHAGISVNTATVMQLYAGIGVVSQTVWRNQHGDDKCHADDYYHN